MPSLKTFLFGLVAAVTLLPNAAQAWWNDEWSLRKPIQIDASAAGANINDPIGALPVLVRLHSGNFRFQSAREDGSDLRFVASDDKTPLKHHIEKFDPLLGEAFVWVNLPDLRPGAKSEIWLYYSNSKAASAEDAKGTYDGSTMLVYHFSNQPARDYSAWGNAATNAGLQSQGGLIGPALKLDGSVPVNLPSSPSLQWNGNDQWSWSAWVKASALQPNTAIFSRREGANALVIGLDAGLPYLQVDSTAGRNRIAGITPVAVESWTHLAVTTDGQQAVLYVNGVAAASGAMALPAMLAPASLGAAEVAATPGAGSAAFIGEIDELQIAKAVRSAGFIKAQAIGQGANGASFVALGLDQETASWISGYFAVILASVTFDGWVVIGLLAIMGLISWYVMVDKALYLGRLENANNRFLDSFRQVAGDLTILDHGDTNHVASLGGRLTDKDGAVIQISSLYRLYHIAAQEIRARMRPGERRPLSAESFAAIRAGLDSCLVREMQKMNRMMVLLTIAISGGPFLGLLGTVVGVMITFAAIAASGDVNVNAIAPGIAAALVATVAGLGVAIPALFAYNWLLIRIKNITSTLQVFIDELVTRMAETYHPDRLPDAPRLHLQQTAE